MSESENVDEDAFSFQEIYDFEARNLTGCDNDDSCCTFPKGYVYRQALYVCITCRQISAKQAAICYPCSVHCHAGHVLEDLYTKRDFRCDCGNGNFPDDFQCKLWEEKDDLNAKNKYNHNFSGRYCVCDAEYNDDDSGDTALDQSHSDAALNSDSCDKNAEKVRQQSQEMLQCVICEDWFHLKHLCNSETELRAIDMDRFEEFVCKQCLASRDYLRLYHQAAMNGLLTLCDTAGDGCNLAAMRRALAAAGGCDTAPSCGAFFMTEWRLSLCRCPDCVAMLKADGSSFLLDARDTLVHYLDNGQTDDNELRQELSNMPYSQAITIAEGIATLKREFTDFLSARDPAKVITADDIYNLFDNIKRRRL